MARPASPNVNYPEINEHFPDFDYNSLTQPPADWELYDIPDKTHLRNRALDLRTFKKLVAHHAWGFNIVIGERKTKENLLQVLKRIIYNQDSNLRPTWHQFVSRDCDSGPRLLRQSYNPPQFSRRLSTGVPGWTPSSQHAIAHPAVSEGETLRNNSTPSVLPSLPSTIPLLAPSRNNSIPFTNLSLGNFVSNQRSMHTQPEANLGFPESTAQDESNIFTNPPNLWTEALATPQNRPPVVAEPPILNQSDLDSLIRKAVSRRACGLLDKALPCMRSLPSIEYSRTSETGSILGAATFSHLRLKISHDLTTLQFDCRGTLYPLKGRGPLSTNGTSDIIDCTIVAGLLTNAGSSVVDEKAGRAWGHNMSPVERAFITAMNDCSNNVFSDAAVMLVRENLWNIYLQYYHPGAAYINRQTIDPAVVWSAFTRPFAQFQHEYADKYETCTQCGNPAAVAQRNRSVATMDYEPQDRDGVEISILLQRYFQNVSHLDCPRCKHLGARKRERIFKTTPLRLVVQPHRQSYVQNVYQCPITVKSTNATGEVVIEKYAYIGSIYKSVSDDGLAHYKVCWNDDDHDSDGRCGRFLRLYDASQISGMIVGGIKSRMPPEVIPNSWRMVGSAVLLFFEKIISVPEARLSIRDNSNQASSSTFPVLNSASNPLNRSHDSNLTRQAQFNTNRQSSTSSRISQRELSNQEVRTSTTTSNTSVQFRNLNSTRPTTNQPFSPTTVPTNRQYPTSFPTGSSASVHQANSNHETNDAFPATNIPAGPENPQQDANAETPSHLQQGLNQATVSAASWELDEFIRANTNLDTRPNQESNDDIMASLMVLTNDSDPNVPITGTQLQGVPGSMFENTAFEDPVVPNLGTVETDNEWLARWDPGPPTRNMEEY